jgi:hypothetical protein
MICLNSRHSPHVHHLLLVYQQFYGNPMALVKAAQAQVTFELDAISSINCISVRADMKRNKNDPHLLNLTIPCEHTHTLFAGTRRRDTAKCAGNRRRHAAKN